MIYGKKTVPIFKLNRISKEYVFRTEEDGTLEFVGDFEGFYQNENDPWGQEGADERLRDYYAFSRSNLLTAIRNLTYSHDNNINILEIGCGLGGVPPRNKTLIKNIWSQGWTSARRQYARQT